MLAEGRGGLGISLVLPIPLWFRLLAPADRLGMVAVPRPPCSPTVLQRQRAFTLVEIMIVVVIIGLLAALAIPAFIRVRQRTQNSRVANDLRVFAQAFDTNLLERGAWPADVAPGVVPAELVGQLPAAWSQPTPIGGQYEWDNEVSLKCITLYETTASITQMRDIDKLIDDGNTATGNFQHNGSEWHYFLER